jgi:hypothetical protein
MIAIEFTNKCSKYRETAIIDAVMFAASELFPRIRKPVYINIRPIRKLAETQGVYGDCMDEDDREFTIRIDVSLSLQDMVSTMIHEMVHVQQYLTGKMKQKWAHEITYNKVVYPHDMDYDVRPWEIEAHRLEKLLAEKYFA